MSAARLAVLASGSGRSLENLCREIEAGRLAAEVALLVSDRPGILALERAARRGIPALVLDWKTAGAERASIEAVAAVEARGCELLVLAGFLRKLVLPERWRGRALNIHPALLPAFGGQGYWGERVHRAVLASGVAESGCTVHYVDDEYDHGPILLQRSVPVLAGDTPETLAARVFEAELEALPEAIRRHLARSQAR